MAKDKEGINGLLRSRRVWPVGIVSIICIACDISPFDYIFPCFERFFSYDMSDVVPIGIAMWVFTTGLITLFLNKKDECYMGITYSELCQIRFQDKFASVENIAIWFVLVMIILVLFNWPITMCLYIFLQFGFMVYNLKVIRQLLKPEESNKLISDDFRKYLKDTIMILNKNDLFNQGYEIYGNKETLIWKVIKGADLTLVSNQKNLTEILLKSDLNSLADDQGTVIGWLLVKNILAVDKSRKTEMQYL